MKNKDKAQGILSRLRKLYPEPKSELNFANSYQLLVSVILSAQCTDKKVNAVTPLLFAQFPTFESLAKATVVNLEHIIRPINYYKTKSKHLIATAKMITEEFAGKVPLKHAEIVRLPGVGRKTANVVLGELGAAKTLPVDTHVFRVARRLGLTSAKTAHGVEEDLCSIYPPSSWRTLHHSLIFHGRRVCSARNPNCKICSLADLCPEGKARNKRAKGK